MTTARKHTDPHLTMSEADFQSRVMDTARMHGWLCVHFRPGMTQRGRWVTAMTGHPGFPDLVLARDGVILVVELKRHGGRLRPGQRAWLAALGGHGRLWTPMDWVDVQRELRDGPDGGAACH